MRPEPGGKIGLAMMAVALAGMIVAGIVTARAERRRRCVWNLKQIGYACHLYSGDHNEEFPPGLGRLFPKYIPDGNVFVCWAARRAVVIRTADLPPGATDASAVFGPANTDYEYVSALAATDPPDLVLAFDKAGNHRAGLNVLFIGANVAWMTEEPFEAALAKTREHVARKTQGEKRRR